MKIDVMLIHELRDPRGRQRRTRRRGIEEAESNLHNLQAYEDIQT